MKTTERMKGIKFEMGFVYCLHKEDNIYKIGQTSDINLTIYNLLGQKVRVLENASRQAGTHTLRWDGRDQMGQDVSTGVYLYTLTNGTKSITKKMALMK